MKEMESESSLRSIKAHVSEQLLHLPEEIIEEILSRLPVKSLLKFRCVSKPWRELIGSKCFVKKHLSKSTENPNFAHHKIILSPKQSPRHLQQCSLLSMLNDPFTVQFTHYHSLSIVWGWIRIVGCCNGIVCLLIDGIRFTLWNPATRKTKLLPVFDHIFMNIRITKYGFGYDDSSGDYMVFGIASLHRSGVIYESLYKFYSLQTNSWKIVEVESLVPFYKEVIFASGKIHLCETGGFITYFDLRNEVFEVIKEPITNGDCCRSMGVFGGRLGMLYDDGVGKLDIWVVKEYGVNASWEKVVNIPYLRTTLDPDLSLLGIGPNGEILLNSPSSFEIIYPESNGFRHCLVRGLGEFGEAVICVESLVSLEGERCIT